MRRRKKKKEMEMRMTVDDQTLGNDAGDVCSPRMCSSLDLYGPSTR